MLGKMTNHVLRKIGYEVHRYNRTRYRDVNASYPLDRNEVAAVRQIITEFCAEEDDEKWSDEQHLQEYLFDRRLFFFEDLLDQCIQRSVVFAGREIADVGTGTGYLLRALHRRCPDARMTGYDWQEPLLRLGRRLCPEAEFRYGDITQTANSPDYDVVFCTEVLEHLNDPENALDAILAQVRAGGIAILTVPDGRKDHMASGRPYGSGTGYWGHINFWSPESWRFFLTRHAEGQRFEAGCLATGENLGLIWRNV